jgi:hypothetical protein
MVTAAALATIAFVIQAVTQLAALGHTSLQYDYKPYFDAGAALNHGDDPYCDVPGCLRPGLVPDRLNLPSPSG